jgi:ubiquinone biosynthesis protein UbiJ
MVLEKIMDEIIYDHTQEYEEKIEPILKQLYAAAHEIGLNSFTLFETASNSEKLKMQGNVMSFTTPGIQMYLCNKIAQDQEFCDRVLAALPILELNDQDLLAQIVVAPDMKLRH